MIQENEMVGLLFNRELASKLDEAECRFATNDERILKALKLIGFESISIEKVQGIEKFCKLQS